MRFILAYISTCRRRIPQPWARLAYYGSNRFLPRLKDYVGACGAASSLPPQYSTCGCDRCHKQPADAVLHESNEWAHAVLYQPAAAVLHCSTQIHQTSTPSACPRTKWVGGWQNKILNPKSKRKSIENYMFESMTARILDIQNSLARNLTELKSYSVALRTT